MRTKVGKYLVTERIARGGMGEILKARHPTLNRDVILKRLAFNSKHVIIERFKREAQLQIDFRNDHIVQVFDHFKEGPSYYIVMEYVDGTSLDALIEKNRYLPDEVALLIFHQIAGALKYAHDKGVIHRDIKPGNILISKEGKVKLTDFGIATSKEAREKYLTREMTLGTPAYMSPEQITDSRNVDKRADIYSMGVVLYEMVTGKCPFPCNMSSEAVRLILKGRYIRPAKLNPKVSSLAAHIIKKAMHHKIKRRYKDLQEIIDLLSARLRKYKSQEMMDEAIRLFVRGKTATPKSSAQRGPSALAFSSGRNLLKAVISFFLLTVIVSGAAFYAYKRGYVHEFYMADTFGALKVEINVHATANGGIPRYVHGTLYAHGPKGNALEKNETLEFTRVRKDNGPEQIVFASPRTYLPSGLYRLVVDIDGKMYQRDFFLRPREAQRNGKEFFDARMISIDHTPITSVPVTFTYEVRDADSGRIITDDTDCFIGHHNRWAKWRDFIGNPASRDLLKSGGSYVFLFSHRDYFNRIVRIHVPPYESHAEIQAELSPLPGVLLIKSNDPDVYLLINNNSYYIEGGYNPRVVKLESLSPRVQRIVLPPNRYYLTARTGSLIKIESIAINSKKYTRVIVNVDRGKGTIAFNVF